MDMQRVQDYLEQILACRIALSLMQVDELPFFVRNAFSFYSGELFGKNIFFLIAKPGLQQHSIKDIESTVFVVKEKVSQAFVLVFESMTRRERLMLIKRHISFIVPGTQMFLPYLGIDFFDRIKEQRIPVSQKLRPAAQAILIEYLANRSDTDEWQLPQIAKFMNYTSMGTHRAANQLEELKLCKIKYDGYRKSILFDPDKRALWERALPYLRSPVKKTIPLEDDTVLYDGTWCYAGEYALARHSRLSVSRKCYAIHEKEYRDLLAQGQIRQADAPGEGIADVQIWSYMLPQNVNESKETVDLFSLELSFKNITDPRIKMALLEIKENRTW